jgi:hypothetical protein
MWHRFASDSIKVTIPQQLPMTTSVQGKREGRLSGEEYVTFMYVTISVEIGGSVRLCDGKKEGEG